MDRVRIGSTFRAIRIELRLRQSDVAARAGVSQQMVSRVERGNFGPISADTLCAIAEAIEADLSVSLRWRGPKLARLLDRRHARLQNRIVQHLAGAGWDTRVEDSFNHFGERGSVDILAWRPDCRALLIIEIKTELVDLQDTVRTLDMKARIVPRVVRRSRGWRPDSVAAVLVLPDANVHRNAVAAHAALLSAALPARTRAVRRWLDAPSGNLRGIWFVPDELRGGVGPGALAPNTHGVSVVRRDVASRRIYRPRTRPIPPVTPVPEPDSTLGEPREVAPRPNSRAAGL
jgi:transcriptional regulator with XRE-family HTH domain